MTARTLSIQDELRDLIARLQSRFGVERALLFGSTAKGDRLEESDIDLIVISKGFEGLCLPERQGAILREWNHPEELNVLTYTPTEFSRVSERLTMREILSYAVDLTPSVESGFCPKCGEKGSLQTKMIKNRSGKSYPFLYFAHYRRGRTSWCYLGSPKRFSTMTLQTVAKKVKGPNHQQVVSDLQEGRTIRL